MNFDCWKAESREAVVAADSPENCDVGGAGWKYEVREWGREEGTLGGVTVAACCCCSCSVAWGMPDTVGRGMVGRPFCDRSWLRRIC